MCGNSKANSEFCLARASNKPARALSVGKIIVILSKLVAPDVANFDNKPVAKVSKNGWPRDMALTLGKVLFMIVRSFQIPDMHLSFSHSIRGSHMHPFSIMNDAKQPAIFLRAVV
jgi:hypothetical protein